ncbi:MAG: hypothetical protein ACWA41_12870 [Putridiphycobacter sp.]
MIKSDKEIIKEWWSRKRKKYNYGLFFSGFISFFCYALELEFLIPFDTNSEITLFTLIPQGIGFLVFVGIANIFYDLGAFVENLISPKNKSVFRKMVFSIGFWFSFMIPFCIPLYLLYKFW